MLYYSFFFAATTTIGFGTGGGRLPESPRSVVVNGKSGQTSNGLLLKSKIEEIRQKGLRKGATNTPSDDQTDKESEDNSKPFTVVRVSSSVSQVILPSIDG